MLYNQVILPVIDTDIRNLLIAELTDVGYSGFEETESSLLAYILKDDIDLPVLELIITKYGYPYQVEEIQEQNWNAVWEGNFQPVIIKDFCTIRADFHFIDIPTPYEIIITPKMSFGTGHHATTQLMLSEMAQIDFSGKTVLDFGTGTGILAILSEKLGAKEILGLDNDKWSYENAKENIERNACRKIELTLEPLENVNSTFDIILANINRNILLQYLHKLQQMINSKGKIIMSGLMADDKEIFLAAIKEISSLSVIYVRELNNWILVLIKAD